MPTNKSGLFNLKIFILQNLKSVFQSKKYSKHMDLIKGQIVVDRLSICLLLSYSGLSMFKIANGVPQGTEYDQCIYCIQACFDTKGKEYRVATGLQNY